MLENGKKPVTLVTSRKTLLTFGLFKGQPIEQVMAEQPGYLVWLHKNVATFDLHHSLLEEAEYDDDDRRNRWELMSGYFWRKGKLWD